MATCVSAWSLICFWSSSNGRVEFIREGRAELCCVYALTILIAAAGSKHSMFVPVHGWMQSKSNSLKQKLIQNFTTVTVARIWRSFHQHFQSVWRRDVILVLLSAAGYFPPPAY